MLGSAALSRMDGRRIILGMGSGRCGTRSLAAVLSRQPGTKVTHEAKPLLPWRNPRSSVIAQRFERMQRAVHDGVVGDVASFYLPYAEMAIAIEPDVRIVCLKRPQDDVVESF